MNYNENSQISDIVLQNYNQVLLLEHFSIPLLVQGKTVGEVCRDNGINPGLYLYFADLFNGYEPTDKYPADRSDGDAIIRFLRNSHNFYTAEKIPKISSYVERICEGSSTSGTKLVAEFAKDYVEELHEHFDYEDKTVFPYVEALCSGKEYKGNYSIKKYKSLHNNVDSKLNDLKELLVKYLYFDDRDHLRRKFLCCLFEMEHDLKIHSHIEDSILIPLVEKLEKEANGETPDAKPGISCFTQREIDVIKCLVMGKSNKEVADALNISVHTVVSHRKNIFDKLGIKSVAGLTIYAILNGIVTIESLEYK